MQTVGGAGAHRVKENGVAVLGDSGGLGVLCARLKHGVWKRKFEALGGRKQVGRGGGVGMGALAPALQILHQPAPAIAGDNSLK